MRSAECTAANGLSRSQRCVAVCCTHKCDSMRFRQFRIRHIPAIRHYPADCAGPCNSPFQPHIYAVLSTASSSSSATHAADRIGPIGSDRSAHIHAYATDTHTHTHIEWLRSADPSARVDLKVGRARIGVLQFVVRLLCDIVCGLVGPATTTNRRCRCVNDRYPCVPPN